MLVEAVNAPGSSLTQVSRVSDAVTAGRSKLEKGDSEAPKDSPQAAEVQPEEILNQIKGLTENGLYSVRFENSQEFDELIVKVVDTETDEVIRQVPAEEVLGVKSSLAELRGNMVNTVR